MESKMGDLGASLPSTSFICETASEPENHILSNHGMKRLKERGTFDITKRNLVKEQNSKNHVAKAVRIVDRNLAQTDSKTMGPNLLQLVHEITVKCPLE